MNKLLLRFLKFLIFTHNLFIYIIFAREREGDKPLIRASTKKSDPPEYKNSHQTSYIAAATWAKFSIIQTELSRGLKLPQYLHKPRF
jgi:hypothetical protein